jgi:hypothetical protein
MRDLTNPRDVAEAEDEIAWSSTQAGRQCGACSMCCLLLHVPEAQKPRAGWCPHCRPGKGGCNIYDQRPNICRVYACMWLVNQAIPDYWAPLRSKMVLDFHHDAEMRFPVLRVHVHPKHPNRWREEPYHSDIRRMAHSGLMGVSGVMGSSKVIYQTVIVDQVTGKYSHIVLPDKDVPFAPGITPGITEDQWEPSVDHA